MKYQHYNIAIPGEKRDDINNKILAIIDDKVKDHNITGEDIFNSYTGRGGLHGLDFDNFDNYHEFSEAKKDYEKGQFFTPPPVCREMVDLIKPGISDLVCDPTCGTGNFFNFLPVEQNCYGCELDPGAAKVAKHLYPDANIIKKDIQDYTPGLSFDYVFGNPPFNLDFGAYKSQHYFCMKAAELLKPGGFLVLIVPLSFLNDDFLLSG
jgi:type I restriction-modification system DNA methylase subunit